MSAETQSVLSQSPDQPRPVTRRTRQVRRLEGPQDALKPSEDYHLTTLGVRSAVHRCNIRKRIQQEMRELEGQRVSKKLVARLEYYLAHNPVKEIMRRLEREGIRAHHGDVTDALKSLDKNSEAILLSYKQLSGAGYWQEKRFLEGVGLAGLVQARAKRDLQLRREEWWPPMPILGQLLPKDKNAPRIMVPDSDVISGGRRELYKPSPRPGEPIFPRLSIAYHAAADGDSIEPFARVMEMRRKKTRGKRQAGYLRTDMLEHDMMHPSQGRPVQSINGVEYPSSHKTPTDPDTWLRAVRILKENSVRTPFGLYRLRKKWRLRPLTAPLIRLLLEERVAHRNMKFLDSEPFNNLRVSKITLARVWRDQKYREACRESGDPELLEVWNNAEAVALSRRRVDPEPDDAFCISGHNAGVGD